MGEFILPSNQKMVPSFPIGRLSNLEARVKALEAGGGGSGTPGGNDTEVQFNNAGAFGGIAAATYDGSTLNVTSAVLHFKTDTTTGMRFDTSTITTNNIRQYIAPDSDGTLALLDFTQTFTNKTINAASNTITNIGASEIEAGIITDLTAETSIASSDLVMIYDASASALRKMTRANFVAGLSGSLPDGDYGDVTVSGTGTVITIDNDVVTYAKMQNVSATSRILGRITSGAGDVEELTGANVKTITGLATTTTDNALTRFDGTSGNTQNSGVTLDDSNNLDGVASIDVDASGAISFGGINIITDSAGVTTLSNIDALNSVTESTIEAAIDTLANLTSVQGLTITLADAGADAIWGWDDSANAYENLTQAEVLAVIGDAAADGSTKGVATFTAADFNSSSGNISIDYANGQKASTTQPGFLTEIAIASEVDTGTDVVRAISPDALAGSNFGIRYISFGLNGTTALTTSDKVYRRIPAGMTGMNLVSVTASVGTGAAGSSSSGTPTFTVKNVTDNNQMLSTNLTVDASEYTSATAATPAVINTSFDDVVTDDLIEVAVTTAGTGVTYAVVTLGFQLP